jgi:hypothetical protein
MDAAWEYHHERHGARQVFFLDRVYVRTTLKESHLSFALLGELKVHHGQANLEVVCSAQSAIFLVGWQ